MGHSHGIKWTSDKIVEEVLKVKNALNVDRLPTRLECDLVTNSKSLSNAITRHFGWYGLAERLGLPLKKSETTTGKTMERMSEDILKSQGFTVERMSQNHPFDLLINNCVKIDVKSSHIYHGINGDYYTFALGKKYHCCDFFMLLELSETDEVIRVMIVPALSVMNMIQISVGIFESKYFKYSDRYDYIEKLIDFHSNYLV